MRYVASVNDKYVKINTCFFESDFVKVIPRWLLKGFYRLVRLSYFSSTKSAIKKTYRNMEAAPGGYDMDFIPDVSEDWMCTVCTVTSKKPVQIAVDIVFVNLVMNN